MRGRSCALLLIMLLACGNDAKSRKEPQSTDFGSMECSGLGAPEEIVECALQAYQSSRIGKVEFGSLLTEAKKNLPSTHTFWGSGLVTGDTMYFAFGKMTDFSFDTMGKIPLRMPVYGEWAPEVALPDKSDRPLAIYPVETFQAPMLNRDYHWNWHNTGGDYFKAAVGIGKEDKVTMPMRENCDAVDADKEIEWARDQSGTAIVLGSNRWCVSRMAKSFDIYVGSFQTKNINFGGEKREMRVFKDGFYKTNSGVTKYGKPNFEVFQ